MIVKSIGGWNMKGESKLMDFPYLSNWYVEDEEIQKFQDATYREFVKLCKNEDGIIEMNSLLNSEWMLRTYCASKMIMAATLLLNSAEYSIEKNLLITVPYLQYYAMFCAARAFLYVCPYRNTSDIPNLMVTSHEKVLNTTYNEIKNHLNKKLAEKIEKMLFTLKGQRELFSYKFPATGLQELVDYEDVVTYCAILAELTELESEQIEKVYKKKILSNSNGDWMILDEDIMKYTFTYFINSEKNKVLEVVDWDDFYRVARHCKYPQAIISTITEGMAEDFFGAWAKNEDDTEDIFNPDDNWQRIFPLP